MPLSYSQELLWLLSQLDGGGVAYNAPAAFRLQGPIDRGALQQALDGLVARHEILRTTYDLVDDRPMQIVAPFGSVELQFVDLSRTAGDGARSRAAATAARGVRARVRSPRRLRAAAVR